VVRGNMSSQAVQVGDRVRVPWGLDMLDGLVEDIYETSSGRRMVVRVVVPGSSQAETVTLPAETIELPEGAETVSPGSWVTGARYERKLGEALQRLLASLRVDTGIQAHMTMGGDRRADYVVQSGNRKVFIEAKSGTHQRHLTTDMVNQLRRQLRYASSGDVAGLLVTNLDLTPSAQRLVRESPRLRVVRWRGSSDDKRLADALASLLSEQ
jgi:Restriction endonuclease